MEMRLNNNLYNEQFSDDSSSDSSDDDSESNHSNQLVRNEDDRKKFDKGSEESENILMKLLNRERTGYLSANLNKRHDQKPFNRVPSRLSFCLKDIVPYCYLQGHMFMGLTVCGQFLVSYKVCYDERSLVTDYNFSTYYKYTLYFWMYRPHHPLGKFFKVCLFDDHGVDNLKEVSMTQWISHPRTLVIHGKSEYENEDSYITIVRVPKLGCLDCIELKDGGDGYFRCDALCIKCNLTIHTKYSTTESDPAFNPYINLICPERVIVFGNGFIHMLHVELEIQRQQQSPQHYQIKQHSNTELASSQKEEKTVIDLNQFDRKAVVPSAEIGCDNKNNIVARIIADFSDCDSEGQSSCEKIRLSDCKNVKNYDELIFTCSMSTSSSSSSSNVSKTSGNTGNQTKVSLLNHKGKRNHRIVTKSYRNGVTTVDLQAASSASNSNDKANAYEFSEDNEKCEKIGTFRKRRLADKKYEFSEDNSENIIPFGKSLSRLSTQSRLSRIHRTLGSSHHSTLSNATHVSAQSSQSVETTNHSHRASPSHGFRSACGSPIQNNRLIKSPPTRSAQQQSLLQKSSTPLLLASSQLQHTNIKPLNTLSLRQITATQRNMDQENTSNNSPFLSPRREDMFFTKVPEISVLGSALEKPICTKKFKRRYVEEDDAASVITSEEDDCISPGYHTSLPMEVHGSCYSDMQMISQTSYQKLKCPTVIITQHSFDVDSFTYYAISNLCQMNNKMYDVFYDWAVELVNVCPRTNSISCILLAHFTARDQLPNNCKKCLNCSRNIDCAFHRKQFECQILFMWNMETGDWEVLNYGELKEIPSVFKGHGTLVKIARGIAGDISRSLDKLHNYAFNLRVLDSNIDKSKSSLTDLENFIEFNRKRPRLCTSNSAGDY